MSKENFNRLIDKHWEPTQYAKECTIFYNGQIPTFAIYLKKGTLSFVKKSKTTEVSQKGLYLLEELVDQKPIKFDLKISSNSAIYILDRSALKQYI